MFEQGTSSFREGAPMIMTFRHKRLEDYFYDGIKKGIQPNHIQKIADILDVLQAATKPSDIDFPGSGLHQLQPKNANR